VTVAGVAVDWSLLAVSEELLLEDAPSLVVPLLDEVLPVVVSLPDEVLPVVVPTLWSRADDAVEVVVVVFAVASVCPIGPT
jgi:hypothetical protein